MPDDTIYNKQAHTHKRWLCVCMCTCHHSRVCVWMAKRLTVEPSLLYCFVFFIPLQKLKRRKFLGNPRVEFFSPADPEMNDTIGKMFFSLDYIKWIWISFFTRSHMKSSTLRSCRRRHRRHRRCRRRWCKYTLSVSLFSQIRFTWIKRINMWQPLIYSPKYNLLNVKIQWRRSHRTCKMHCMPCAVWERVVRRRECSLDKNNK